MSYYEAKFSEHSEQSYEWGAKNLPSETGWDLVNAKAAVQGENCFVYLLESKGFTLSPVYHVLSFETGVIRGTENQLEIGPKRLRVSNSALRHPEW